LLPQLGQPVEPVERRPVVTWWRSIAPSELVPPIEKISQEQKLADNLPWPLD